MNSTARADRIMLIGMMGAGKTTVGTALAARLGCEYCDSDAMVQAETGQTVPEIFKTQGEAAFRAAEAAVLREALTSNRAVVVGVAGGAVLDPANREALREAGTIVWLRADPGTRAGRVGEGAGRPLLEGSPAENLAALDAVRRPLYEELADLVIDVDDLTPEEIVERVMELVP